MTHEETLALQCNLSSNKNTTKHKLCTFFVNCNVWSLYTTVEEKNKKTFNKSGEKEKE
jgi:hypothetical protein